MKELQKKKNYIIHKLLANLSKTGKIEQPSNKFRKYPFIGSRVFPYKRTAAGMQKDGQMYSHRG
jgi:hypothetical protein